MQLLLFVFGILMLMSPTAVVHSQWGWERPWLEPAAGPRLGVMIGDVSFEDLDARKLAYGVEVTRVLPDSPAKAAGLRPGDVLVELDGQALFSVARVQWLVRKADPDKAVELKYYRRGKPLSTEINPARSPRQTLSRPESPREISRPSGAYLGVILQSLTPGLREAFSVPEGLGMLVTEVVAGGPADRAGLRAGDVIIKLDRRAIHDMQDVWRVLEYLEPGQEMPAELIRDGKTKQFPVTLGERKAPDVYYEYRGWRGRHGDDRPFLGDPEWWRGMGDFMQWWQEHWDDRDVGTPHRPL